MRVIPFAGAPFMLALLTLVACDRDEEDRYTLDRPLFLHADSACVQLPNVFTPNADGINDLLVPLGNNVTSLRMTVTDLDGNTLHDAYGTAQHWDGSLNGNALPNGRYRVQLTAWSTSGVRLIGSTTVFRAGAPAYTCFTDDREPVTPDMLDPRQCAPIYSSNDLFCTAFDGQ